MYGGQEIERLFLLCSNGRPSDTTDLIQYSPLNFRTFDAPAAA
jgi:hypothetical protein